MNKTLSLFWPNSLFCNIFVIILIENSFVHSFHLEICSDVLTFGLQRVTVKETLVFA